MVNGAVNSIFSEHVKTGTPPLSEYLPGAMDSSPPAYVDLNVDVSETITLHVISYAAARSDAPGRTSPTTPILLVHGFTQTAHSWDDVGPPLAALGFPVFALDLRGHGQSSWCPQGDYSRATMKRDIIAVCDSLFGSEERFYLVGLSMGAALCSAAAASLGSSRVRGLVLVDWAPWPEDSDGKGQATVGVQGIVRIFSRRWQSFEEAETEMSLFNPRRSKEQIATRLQQQLRQDSRDGRWRWNTDPAIVHSASERASEPPSVMWALLRSIEKEGIAVVVVRGKRSAVIRPEQAKRLAITVGAGTHVEVERAGHSVPGDDPKGFLDVIVPFVGGEHDLKRGSRL